ncbi:MAG TPA: T9SS type A sorting domain-containing protein, partial [Edaphocola sp.]|nr:T9SS type A sorting domain-containing protein [Edaphocola sp.]
IEANGRDVRQMSIYDAQGRLILLINKQSNSINTANLQAGTYIIEIQTSKGDKIRKIFTKL